jgi:undecaprenyl-diphosphatase
LGAFDAMVRAAVAAGRTPTGVSIMLAVSHISSEYGTPLTVVALAAWLWRRDPVWAKHLVLVNLTSTGWQIALKHLVRQPRPLPPLVPYWVGYGYPSGHTLTALCLAVMLLWYLAGSGRAKRAHQAGRAAGGLGPRRVSALWTVLLAWPALVGWSRMYIDAHWLSDVVAGALLGFMHVGAWYYFLGWRLRREADNPS